MRIYARPGTAAGSGGGVGEQLENTHRRAFVLEPNKSQRLLKGQCISVLLELGWKSEARICGTDRV